MTSSPFSKNCKPPKPPILAWLSGGLSVKIRYFSTLIFKKKTIKMEDKLFLLVVRLPHYGKIVIDVKG